MEENRELIEKAVSYIDSGCKIAEVSVEEVAQNAGFSMDYFNRIFRNHTGFNVMEYVRFRRMCRGAMKLRKDVDKDVLTIALECGYDSHDGFTRAFKAHFGKTPAEYRKAFKDQPMVFADLGLNATAQGRFTALLPEFYPVDTDEAIDYLLNLDAKRFGYEAITLHVNGSQVLADTDYEKRGVLVFAEYFFGDQGPSLTLKCRGLADLPSYLPRLLKVKPRDLYLVMEEEASEEQVKDALEGMSYSELSSIPRALYLEKPFDLPKKEDFFCRPLEAGDEAELQRFGSQADMMDPMVRYMCQMLKNPPLLRDALPIGYFHKDALVGLSSLSVQETHGYRINNCVSMRMHPRYKSREHFEYLYKFSVNEAIAQNALPFDDSQFGANAIEHGGFEATDLGFLRVLTTYHISF